MKLYRTAGGVFLESAAGFHRVDEDWDALVNREELARHLRTLAESTPTTELREAPLAPVGAQEVWAAGVTYYRSRTARMEESREAGGGSFYDRVYDAPRPELFFKSAGWRVRAPGEPVRVRRDSRWSVPEPELALFVNARGLVVGYTIGNDMSARDIEGENPLYLPQAKIWDGGCALGPALLVHDGTLPSETAVSMRIARDGAVAFEGSTRLAQLRRTPAELAAWLYRETSFPHGCVLLTGTGVVPPDDFALRTGDAVRIEIGPIGVLENVVE